MNEAKHERFLKVVEKRMEVIINDFQKLGNCSARTSYDYSEKEVEQITAELERQIANLKERFAGKKAFSLATSGDETAYTESIDCRID